jgi:thioredoxin reductase (NADPH)
VTGSFSALPAANPEVAFPTLTDAQFARLITFGTPADVEVGELVFRAGDPTTDLYVVESAWIEVFRNAIRDSPVDSIVTHGPGRFVGEFSLFTGQTLYLSGRVVSAGRIHLINADGFRNMMASDPELSDLVLRALLARREMLRSGPAARTIEILGAESSAGSLALRTYANRQMLAHTWIDADSPEGADLRRSYALEPADLPCLVLLGEPIVRATPGILAERIGLAHRPDDVTVDLTVVGGGPAGLAAAVYGASEGLHTVLLDGIGVGGQAATSSRIENYLGFPFGVSGGDLADLAQVQAVKFGARLSSPCQVVKLDASGPDLRLVLADGSTISTRAVIAATGAHYRRLPIPRWADFEGAGIYFAATKLEAHSCRADPVVVIGGANSAGQASLFLAAAGSQVTLVVRAADITKEMSAYLVDRLQAHPFVTIRAGTEVTELDGDHSLRAVTLTERDSGTTATQACVGLFCFIGAEPTTSWLDGVALHEDGFIRTDVTLTAADLGAKWETLERQPLPFETSIPRVFAVGDVRYGSMKRIAAAVGEGASAVRSVHASLAPPP